MTGKPRDASKTAESENPGPVRIEDLGELQQVEAPCVSPDGQQVACVLRGIDLEANGYRRAIYVFAADGSGGRRLTAGPRDGMPCWSPDGRMLAFERSPEGEKPQIHLIALAGGEARAITRLPRGATSPIWSPSGDRIAFLSASDAAEREREARELEAAGKAPADAPDQPAPAPDAEDAAERHDPRVIDRLPYRSGTQYHERENHVYVLEIAVSDDDGLAPSSPKPVSPAPEPKRITSGDGTYAISRWSPDGRWIYGWGLVDYEAHDRFGAGEALAFPAEGGQPLCLSSPEQRSGMPLPSPCGRYLAWSVSPRDRTFSVGGYLAIGALGALSSDAAPGSSDTRDEAPDAATAHRPNPLPLVATTAAFDRVIEGFAWSEDGEALLLQCPDRGASRLFRFDLASALAAADTLDVDLDALAWPAPDRRPATPHVTPIAALDHDLRYVTSFDVSGGCLAAAVSTPEHPSDLYSLAVDRTARPAPDSAARRLTEVSAGYLAERALAETEEIWFDAEDGHRVQGWLIRPPGASTPEAGAPLLLEIHGGPHAMWGPAEPSMWHEFQVLAARGYAVFYCNPRGSNGYGRRHRMAIHRNWGFAEEHDFLSGLDTALARGGLDPERIGVTGGSYGGYMTAWLVARHARFGAAASQRGVYDLVSFSGTTDIPRFTEQIFETTTWEGVETLWRHSPISQVAGIQAPLLILHAERDYRVPISGAEQLFSALKRLGRKVQLVRYPREGHELSRSGEPKHRMDRLERIAGWFDTYL